MADANARALGFRETGAVVGVGSGRVVVAGEGGVDGDGGGGPVVIACDNFEGARGPCNRKNRQKFPFNFHRSISRNNTDDNVELGGEKKKKEGSPVRVETAAVRPGRCLPAAD